MRTLARSDEHGLRLTTRSGADATDRFPEVSRRRSEAIPADSVLDGEVVALDDLGRPSFALLSPRIQRSTPPGTVVRPVTYVVFDVLRVAGSDVLERPYDERRGLLADLVAPGDGRIIVADAFDDGAALLAGTAAAGLEGVVAKRRSSRYRPGVRSPDWIKVPHRRTRSYVIGGWKARPDSPSRIASVLVGSPTVDGALAYDGAVGSGLTARESQALIEVLRDIETPTAPFSAVPDEVDGILRWVEPVLVADVEHLGRSGHGHLRQPSLVRLRPDLSYDSVLMGVDES
jgi:bifunctional non-homologous end joining protein LigD